MNLSIISLIYASPNYAVEFYSKLLKVTPELSSKDIEFYFVANNATKRVIKTLKRHRIPFIPFKYVEKRVFHESSAHKIVGPAYLKSVYAAYNYGISQAKFDNVLLLNSDMVMSPGWLPKVSKEWNHENILSPILVERNQPRFGVFPGALCEDFGSNFRNFQIGRWEKFTSERTSKENEQISCKSYMPAILKKNWILENGFFPEGNLETIISNGEKKVVSGDEFLYSKIRSKGIPHETSRVTYCYHFKEGERSSTLVGRTRKGILDFLLTIKHKLENVFSVNSPFMHE